MGNYVVYNQIVKSFVSFTSQILCHFNFHNLYYRFIQNNNKQFLNYNKP